MKFSVSVKSGWVNWSQSSFSIHYSKDLRWEKSAFSYKGEKRGSFFKLYIPVKCPFNDVFIIYLRKVKRSCASHWELFLDRVTQIYFSECVINFKKSHSNNTSLVLRKQIFYTLMFHMSFSYHPISSAVGTWKELASNLKH